MLEQPHHPAHVARTATKARRENFAAGMHVSITGDVGTWAGPACMGIDWMSGDELSQAIPPPYTEWLGRQLLAHLEVADDARGACFYPCCAGHGEEVK
jgi:DNA (cytosine-5)-methyltransferase 1